MKYKETDCPRYSKCSASICPLDADWSKRNMLETDRVCIFLRELAKDGGYAVLRGVIPEEMAKAILAQLPKLFDRHRLIRKALRISKNYPSKILSIKRIA